MSSRSLEAPRTAAIHGTVLAMRTLALAAVLTGCAHSEPPPPPPTAPTQASECKRALAETPDPALTPEQRQRFDALEPERQALIQVCIEDHWPTTVIDCFSAAKDASALTGCMDGKLSD